MLKIAPKIAPCVQGFLKEYCTHETIWMGEAKCLL